MPKCEGEKTKSKSLCIDDLRHAEYYGMQDTYDELYAKSRNEEIFDALMDLILSRDNILLAYRNIKANTGSMTAGTDKLTIKDIGRMTPEEVIEKVRFIVGGSEHGYRPKPVRRKEIPKPNGKMRPLGIPCIWDRLVQQCIKQVLEPICEAKFSDNSHGFRPDRKVEHAIASLYSLIQTSKLYYVVEFDIKGFFDNVNHSKLLRQLWAMGIRDKHLLYVIRQILKAPIKLQNGEIQIPEKGTPQGGIISPLLANVVLNELDRWVESQWQDHPVASKYYIGKRANGGENKGTGYREMKKTKLKEMHIVRYADDFRILCRNEEDAKKTLKAVELWLKERLKLELSPNKTRIVNVCERYTEFLGFKIKVQDKKGTKTIVSHVSDQQLKQEKQKLKEQARNIGKPRYPRTEYEEIHLYNTMVTGMQNYYQLATHIGGDFVKIQYEVTGCLANALSTSHGTRLVKNGRKLTENENRRYGKSAMLRFVAGSGEPIYPIGYITHKNAYSKKRQACRYTKEGRKLLHGSLTVNHNIIRAMRKEPLYDRSIEYADNRISKYTAQQGKCAVTGVEFRTIEDIHCHHIKPRSLGGTDRYGNLTLILDDVHKLVHANTVETINKYLMKCNLTKDQLDKVNNLREEANLGKICNHN